MKLTNKITLTAFMILIIGASMMIYDANVHNNSSMTDSMGNLTITSIGFLTFFLGLFTAIIFIIEGGKSKPKKRRAFTTETKKRVLNKQNHRCKICGVYPKNWNFDHIGSRGDNSAENCQALCLDCHADKTKREKRQSKNNLKNINEKPEKSLGQNIWKITKDTASQFTDDQTKKKKKR